MLDLEAPDLPFAIGGEGGNAEPEGKGEAGPVAQSTAIFAGLDMQARCCIGLREAGMSIARTAALAGCSIA